MTEIKPPRPALKPVPTLLERLETAVSAAGEKLSSAATSAYSTAVHYAATCCPEVSTFGKSATRSNYSGFDDKTNLIQTVGVDEYWIPPTKSKSLPSNKEARDGANWVSVGVGKTIEVVISFAAYSGAGCLGNCTYKVDNTAIAEVVTTNITADNSSFGIRGKAAGECSVEVICTGKTLGYIHVWCAAAVTIDVEVCSIVTANSGTASYVAADLQSYINDVYSDLFISVNIIDKGAITVLSPNSNYSTSTPDLLALDTLVQVAAKPPFTAPYRLYYYLNAAGHSGGLGMVPGGVGVGRAGFSFFDHDVQGAYNTMAHELGHCFNLSHPLHDFDQDEFPAHHIASLTGNVMSVDPWNLMGYNGSVAQRGPSRKNLRYRQWKKCKRS